MGCIAASAKNQSCDAGAIGAAVGEMVGDYLIKPSQEIVLDDGSVVAVLTEDEIRTIHNIAKLSAGSIALLSHVDVDTAVNSAQTAVENNAVWAVIPAVIWVADKAWTAYQVYQDIQALQNGTKTWEQLAREKGTEYMAQAILGNVAKFGLKAVKSGSGYALRKVAQTCSFRGDMLIKTVSGYKTIDSISIGDQVLSRNEQTGAVSFQTVLNQYNNAYKQTVYIDIIDADGNKQTIVSNTIHTFFVKIDNNTSVPPSSEGHHYKGEIENAHWVDASNLKAGYKLLSENGQWQIVQNIKVTDEPLSAYNLTVNNDHTYFVTGSGTTYGVWVHNSCADNLLKGYKGQKLSYGSNVITIDKSGIKHILERHHPNYWDGSVKTNQTFLDKSMSVNDIEEGIKSVLGQNSALLRSGKRDGQIEGLYNGKRYVLGLRDGVVGQFYPK